MRSTEHETWTEYHWDVGDVVRLKEDERLGLGSIGGKADEFGRITDVRDGYYMTLSLVGFSRGPDSYGNHVRVSRFALEPWIREPRDEAALRRNVVALLRGLAWSLDTTCKVSPHGVIRLDGVSVGMMHGRSTLYANAVVAADALPFLGDGKGSLDEPGSIDWKVNADGQKLLDEADAPAFRDLAGGGNAFRMSVGRDGTFRAKDLGTGDDHVFRGVEARGLVDANRSEVGMLTDGRMPEILRAALPYPRTLRLDAGRDVLVVETEADAVSVTRNGETGHLDGAEAKSVRRACARIVDMGKWLDARPELIHDGAPAPGMR